MSPGSPVFKAGTDDAKEFLKAEPPVVDLICRLKNSRLLDVLIPLSLMRHRKLTGRFYMSVGGIITKTV
jgi:hypothetical protein